MPYIIIESFEDGLEIIDLLDVTYAQSRMHYHNIEVTDIWVGERGELQRLGRSLGCDDDENQAYRAIWAPRQ